jgi:predicted transcriptional regulator YdeE
MKLSRLGSFHQSKLSFLRSFIREFKDWEFKTEHFNLDNNGYGEIVYSLNFEEKHYSLICFANDLDDSERSDRVIATKWDSSFVLFDGIPKQEDIQRLKNNVPLQEQGRTTFKELALSRANKSVRTFEHVVNALAAGNQPDKQLLSKVGYLYRTTAVYGSGKFGLADRFRISDRPELKGPFRLEMMLVYFVRKFTIDQVNHTAKAKNPSSAVTLDDDIARNLGIGNSTGLGMAPFIVNHPTLLHQWIVAREKALQIVRSIHRVSNKEIGVFRKYLEQSMDNMETWVTDSEFQAKKNNSLKEDLKYFKSYFSDLTARDYFWNEVYLWVSENMEDEGIEFIVSLMMEPYGQLVEPLCDDMSVDEDKYFTIEGSRPTQDIKKIIENYYQWLISVDFEEKENITNFWYYSKNKQEPRLSNRFEEDGSENELPLAIARDIKKLYLEISKFEPKATIAEFLLSNQDLRYVVRRVLICEKFPYSEIQDNTTADTIIPIDMLRLKLSYFGAVRFDPRSDLWLRITMYQGAPLPHEMKFSDDSWAFRSLN